MNYQLSSEEKRNIKQLLRHGGLSLLGLGTAAGATAILWIGAGETIQQQVCPPTAFCQNYLLPTFVPFLSGLYLAREGRRRLIIEAERLSSLEEKAEEKNL